MLYFAYGSNMNLKQMEERCPKNKFLGCAKLNNHRFVFDGFSQTRGGAVANIIDSLGDFVWGGLFEITEVDLKSLDRYEGYSTRIYDRKKIQCFLGGEEINDVIAYYRTGEKLGEPSLKYRNIILRGAQNCNLPKEYIRQIKNA